MTAADATLARSFRLFCFLLVFLFATKKVAVERMDHVMSLVLTSSKAKKAGEEKAEQNKRERREEKEEAEDER
ncbi:uncharacterized protein ARB_02483 [Trichophyton benhamiae CBS 112371]|uniref:Uncharacterized protein n=2 Tax=Trichophyton TaxID=5550 RepID=D4B202_ARTBC|nr:uncharacterized protein ARB_02483 [Trichophyton benhamiae CBS 112371]XP_003018659.1 uncharacterized protein TRV_07349 [Trichophyton verrucosum HKI 0517]EFE30563.1 hypothetical protein ARB_02483 [Trichophyton benhamiae CBS 112371]EFE38014.1 hypothetical protein TRV_07349 [Trichophyton verrucosum HKI 0517]